MKYEKFIKLPLPPYPLPAPRYRDHFRAPEKLYIDRILLNGMTDESILIRSNMYQLFRASEKHTTASQLTHDLDLFSHGALRLARTLHTRRNLHYRRLEDPKDRVQADQPPAKDDFHRPSQIPPQSGGIRSSENTHGHIFINNPLVLSDLARSRLEPALFRKKDPFPGRGRPSIDLYAVLEGILYKFLANISWSDLPDHYPSSGTCNRYYLTWKRDGTLLIIMVLLIALEIDMQYENEKASEAWLGTFFKQPPARDSPDESTGLT